MKMLNVHVFLCCMLNVAVVKINVVILALVVVRDGGTDNLDKLLIFHQAVGGNICLSEYLINCNI